jgi:hypothetical protein
MSEEDLNDFRTLTDNVSSVSNIKEQMTVFAERQDELRNLDKHDVVDVTAIELKFHDLKLISSFDAGVIERSFAHHLRSNNIPQMNRLIEYRDVIFLFSF